MPLLMVAIGVVLLIILIMGFKLNAFFSLIIVSFVVALFLGMPLDKVITSVEAGLGGTLGHIALILGLGAMLGRLIAEAGGAHRISVTLIHKFGEKRIHWAVITASFIVGIALYYDVAFVLIIPIVFTMAKELKLSITSLGLSMAAALVTTHSFLPPHPGPTVIAGEYHAEIAMVLLYGIIVAIPTVMIAGIWYPKAAKKFVPSAFTREGNIEALGEQKQFKLEDTPGFGVSVLTAMFPVLLMAISAILDIIQKSAGFADNMFIKVIRFVGSSDVAMIISLLLAVYTMGLARKIPLKSLMDSCSSAINAIGLLILITGGGGAFKQVIIDGGVGKYIAKIFEGSSISPILLAWIVAAILRICLGSGTVAALSTAGLVIPLLGNYPHVNLALVTLATGCGTAFASHVNDPGFWMVKEFFGLSLKETFATYTVLSSLASIVGIILILLLNISWIIPTAITVLSIILAVSFGLFDKLKDKRTQFENVQAD